MEMEYVFLLLLLSSAIGEIIVSPRNTEGSVGETTTLDCTVTDGTCEWRHYPIDANSNELVYKGGDIYNGYKVRFNVTKDNGGACNLVISNVSLDDAGRYTCMEMSEIEIKQKAAELVVFGVYPSDSSCSAKYICPPECDTWEISCRMSYRGNIEPTMEWKTLEGNVAHSRSSTANSGIIINAIRVQYDVENSYSYICQVKYPSNSLESKYNWSFQRQARSSTSKDNHDVTEPQQQPHTIALTTVYLMILVAMAIAVFLTLLVVSVVWKRKDCRKWVRNLRSRQRKTGDEEEQVHLGTEVNEGEQDQFANIGYDTSIIAPRTKDNRHNAIHGFSLLNDEVFISTRASSIIEVFDIHTSVFKHHWMVPGLVDPNDMVSCLRRNVLYICDWKKAGSDKEVFCVDKNGTVQNSWISEGERGRLSITDEGNIIVAESWYNVIKEYTMEGKLISKIETGKFKMHLWHAIKLCNGNFVASFGDQEDEGQEICIINNEGETLKSFSRHMSLEFGTPMKVPRSLAVGDEGTVYVADLYNGRIIILSSELGWVKELRTSASGVELKGPLRIQLHTTSSGKTLYVADSNKEDRKWRDGRILVFNVDNQESSQIRDDRVTLPLEVD